MAMSNLPKDFKPVTLQHIFNLAVTEFLVNDAPPAVENGTCKYITSDGRKCAVGLALPDKHQAQASYQRFNTLVRGYPELFDKSVHGLSAGGGFDVPLNDFQVSLHDSLQHNGKWCFTKERRVQKYKEVAKKFNLKLPDNFPGDQNA